MSDRVPPAATRAVFLSYASQDAAAARRICDALRAAGIEVWFDQSELRGGDAWDAKIRKQIKECALFVPIISANTQTRLEGYYRLEWKLAVDRSHLMAEERVFFVPVVIDPTTDAEAKVPDRFRDLQWTRLSLRPAGTGADGVPLAALVTRVKQLLAGAEVAGGADPGQAVRSIPQPGSATPATTKKPMRSRRWVISMLAAGVLLAVAVGLKLTRQDGRVDSPGAAGEARRLAERARRHCQGIFTRADLAQAEELGKRATDLEPTLALAWAVRAGANACHLMRGFVTGEVAQQRAREAQAFAERALAIHRDETEALIALGQVAMFQRSPAQAEAYFRRVIKNEPDNPFARRYLSIVLRSTDRAAEAIEVMEESVKRFPRDTLSHFDLALAYAYGWNWPQSWEAAGAALAIEPFPGALMLKVRLAFQWKGDVALIRQLLDQLDVTYRGEDDAVVWDMRCGLFERRPERVLEAAGRTSRTFLEESFIFPAPKAWFTAQAYHIAGKPSLARQHWEIAAAVIRDRLKADPQNLDLQLKLAVTLAWMKEKETAALQLKAIESAWREQLNPERAWDLASFYAASGDAKTAVPLLGQALHAGNGLAPLTLKQLKLDPWWDEIRDTPEFAALLQNAPPLPAPVKRK